MLLIKQWPINTRILCTCIRMYIHAGCIYICTLYVHMYVHTCCLYLHMYLVRCTYILNVHTSGYLLFSQVIGARFRSPHTSGKARLPVVEYYEFGPRSESGVPSIRLPS